MFKGLTGQVRFTKEKVSAKLKKLKPSSASGPDRVRTRILHDLADDLAEPLALIYSRLKKTNDQTRKTETPAVVT